MEKNTIEKIVVPEIPKVIPKQEMTMYVPEAYYDVPGIAKYDSKSFVVKDGKVSLRKDYSLRSIVDFTVDTVTGVGKIYYDDGTISTINFPVYSEGKLDRKLITKIEFVSNGAGEFSWVYDSGSYLLTVSLSDMNVSEDYIVVVEEKIGTDYYVQPTTIIKRGRNILLSSTEPYNGRLLILDDNHGLIDYQTKTDEKLNTTDKTIVGAINELNTTVKTKVDKLVTNGDGTKFLSDNGKYKEINVDLNIENGEGGSSIVQKQSTKEGESYVTGSTGTSRVADSTAKGASAVSLNVRNNAKGDASIAGGYSSTANTKADVAFNTSNSGITEENYYKIYPKGFLLSSEYLTYEQYKKRVVNGSFSCNSGKAIGVKTFSAGSHAVIDLRDAQGNKTGQIETGSWAENSATFGQNCRTVVSYDEEGNVLENARNSFIGGTASSIHNPHSFGYGKSLIIPRRIITHDGKEQEISTATFGQFNQQYHPDYVTILEIGNGKSDKKDANGLYTEHSNAFEVLWDGRAKVQSPPRDANDVVRLGDLTSGGGTQLYKHEFNTNIYTNPDGFNKVVIINTRSTPYATRQEIEQDVLAILSMNVIIYRPYEYEGETVDRCYGVCHTPYIDGGTPMLLYEDFDYMESSYATFRDFIGTTIKEYAPEPLQGE